MKPLSREFLLSRGYCCNNECVNCPYKDDDKEIRTENAIRNLIKMYPNDADLGKQIRKRYSQFK